MLAECRCRLLCALGHASTGCAPSRARRLLGLGGLSTVSLDARPRRTSRVSWPLDPTVYAGVAALFLGHAWLACRVDDAQPRHTLYFGLGLVTLWVALETPIDTISDHYLESVHMLQHVLLGFVAPPLMLLGCRGRWPEFWPASRS